MHYAMHHWTTMKKLIWLHILTGAGAIIKTVTGTVPLVLENAIAAAIAELKQYGKCEQRNLPQGFTELDYIHSAGDAYIDTGITLDEDDEVEILFRMASADQSSAQIFGYRDGASSNNIVLATSYSKSLVVDFNNSSFSTYRAITSGVYSADTVYRAVLNKNLRAIYDGSTAVCSNSTPCPDTITTGNVYIGYVGGSPAATNKVSCDFLSVVIKGKANFVPAKRDSDNAVGMLNTVDGTFHASADDNAPFTAGSVTVPTPSNPMSVWCNNGKLSVRKPSGLPLGYQLLEYIEADNGPFFATSVKLASTDVVEAEFANNSSTGYGGLYGVYATGESSAFYANQTYYGYDAVNNKVDTGVAVDTEWHTVVHDFVNGKLTLDGVDTAFTPFEFTNANNCALFARYYGGSYGYFFRGKVRKFKVTRNGVVICNLLPAKRIADDELGFYDLATDTFYTNDGTGNFTAGSAASDPVEVYASGTPETLTVLSAGETNLFNGLQVSFSVSKYTVALVPDMFNPTGFNATAKSGTTDTSGIVMRCPAEWFSENTSYSLTGICGASFAVGRGTSGDNITYYREASTDAIFTITDIAEGQNQIIIRIYFGVQPEGTQFNCPNIALAECETQTATVSSLLAVGDYADTEELIAGIKTGKVGVKVLTGDVTKDGYWGTSAGASNLYSLTIADSSTDNAFSPLSTHFVGVTGNTGYSAIQNGQFKHGSNTNTYYFKDTSSEDVTAFKAKIATAYASGNPYIVIYPLATETTEQTTAHALTTAQGTNTVSATANVSDIQAEIKYMGIDAA